MKNALNAALKKYFLFFLVGAVAACKVENSLQGREVGVDGNENYGDPDLVDMAEKDETENGLGSAEEPDSFQRITDLPILFFGVTDFCVGYRFDEGVHQRTDNGKADDCGVNPGRNSEELGYDGSFGKTDSQKDQSVHVFVDDPVEYRTEITLAVGFPGHISIDEVQYGGDRKQDTAEEEQTLHITYSAGNTENEGKYCYLVWFKSNPDEGIADWINAANQPGTKSGNIHGNLTASYA